MLSRLDATEERGMLHPRILDVTEALIGPDVYAVQSMLIGAWIALEQVE